MTEGELQDAIRRALGLLDSWVQCTGALQTATSYYYELQSIIEDAVHCGAQAATGDFRRLEAEDDDATIPGWREPTSGDGQ